VEGDRHSVVVAIAKPTSHLLDHLDLAFEAFGCGVGDVKLEGGQDIGQVSMQGLDRLDEGNVFERINFLYLPLSFD